MQSAVSNIVTLATWELRQNGYEAEADRVASEWEAQFANQNLATMDVGDHAPLCEWMNELSALLEETLGETIMSMTHLDDIRILNYTIPVALDPQNENWDQAEYGAHFVPFSGTVRY